MSYHFSKPFRSVEAVDGWMDTDRMAMPSPTTGQKAGR